MKAIPSTLREQAARIADQLKDVTPEDVFLMVLGAGFDALEQSLDEKGSIEMPLQLHIDAPGSPEIRAKAFVPPAQLQKVRDLSESSGRSFVFVSQTALAVGLNHLAAERGDLVHTSRPKEVPLFGAAYFKVIDGGAARAGATVTESSGFRARYIEGDKGVSYRKVEVTMRIPVSELEEFRSYQIDSRTGISFEKSIMVGSPSSADDRWEYSLDTRVNVCPSWKGIIKRVNRLIRKEATTEISFELSEEVWLRAKARAEHYGISLHMHCLACIGYHASVWRADQKRKKRDRLDAFPRFGAPNARLV